MKRMRCATALLLAVCLTVLPLSAAQPVPVSAESTEETMLRNAEIIINTVNDIRVSYGLSELATTPLLLDVSQIRAEELQTSFDHYRPDGSVCFTALKNAGIRYTYSAENIAAGRSDPVATVQQWMASEGHRENILGESYTHIGIGYSYAADSTYGYYWCMFLIGTYDGSDPYVYEDQYIPERELGDANGTKSINASDAAVILEYAAATAAGISYPVTAAFSKAADVNTDGNVDAVDASIILSYAATVGSGEKRELAEFIW